MQGKKQIDIPSWKDRLDSPDELSGERMADKNLAWEKLSGRLHTDRRPVTRYWIAAAILLLLTVSWLLLERRNNNEWVRAHVQRSRDTAAAHFDISHPVSENRNIVALPADRQFLIVAPVKQHRLLYKNSRSAGKSQLVAGFMKTDEKSSAPAMVIAPPAETVAITLVVSKKKLRVVHINELDAITTPVQAQSALAAASWKTNNWLKIKNNSSPSSSATGRQEDTRIKIPLTN